MKRGLLLLPGLLLSGCVSQPVPADYPVSPTMATTFSDGEATITWMAEINETYTVYYTDTPPGQRAVWTPLPQASTLPGTGADVTVRDQPGQNSTRRYLLLAGEQKPY